MSFSYTSNLLRGFQTSPQVQEYHRITALRINASLLEHAAVMGDKTRSRGEKAPMLAKLSQKLEQDAQREIKAFRSNLEARIATLEKQKAEILKSMTMADALALTNAMKGLEPGAMIAACRESRELSLAMAIVPSSISGFSKEQAVETLIDAHFPALKAENEAWDADATAFKSLERNVGDTVRRLSNDVDWGALESRYDEKRLEPTPHPKTMAEQNQQLADLEKAAGIKPTGE